MTPDPNRSNPDKPADDIERLASRPQRGIVAEFTDFLIHNKKWWLAPIVIMLVLLGLFVILGNTGVLPFIYTVF